MKAYKEYKLKIVHVKNCTTRTKRVVGQKYLQSSVWGRFVQGGKIVPSVSPSPSQVKILIDYVSPFVLSIGAPCLSVIVES